MKGVVIGHETARPRPTECQCLKELRRHPPSRRFGGTGIGQHERRGKGKAEAAVIFGVAQHNAAAGAAQAATLLPDQCARDRHVSQQRPANQERDPAERRHRTECSDTGECQSVETP